MHAHGNIALVGFMGTGKSHVGRLLAERLGLRFVDMDTAIEARAGKPISRIFAEDGEPHFRELERVLAAELAAQSGLVIATGGGIVLNPENVRALGATGLVVCLQATPETILGRIAHETHRPLLATADQRGRISELLARRQPLYDAIPCRLATDALTPEAAADWIVAQYRAR